MGLGNAESNAVSYLTLAFIAALLFLGVVCLFYLTLFRRRFYKKRLTVLSDFYSLWIVRLALVFLASSWALLESFRLPLLRRPGWAFHDLSHKSQTSLCRAYAVLSMGVLEPCFYLTTFHLLKYSLSDPHPSSHPIHNLKSFLPIPALAFPLLLIQLILNVILPSLDIDEGLNGAIPKYFTRTFVSDTDAPLHECKAMCTYSLLSSVVLCSFALPYVVFYLFTCWKMLNFALNHKLRKRIFLLEAILLFLLPMRITFLGFTAISEAGRNAFEFLAFAAFLPNIVFFSLIEILLIIFPLNEALEAVRVVEWKRRFNEMGDGFTDDEDLVRQRNLCPLPLISNKYMTLSSVSSSLDRAETSSPPRNTTSNKTAVPTMSMTASAVGSNVAKSKAEFVPPLHTPVNRHARRTSKTGKSMEEINLMGNDDYSHSLMFAMSIASSNDASGSSLSMNESNLIEDRDRNKSVDIV